MPHLPSAFLLLTLAAPPQGTLPSDDLHEIAHSPCGTELTDDARARVLALANTGGYPPLDSILDPQSFVVPMTVHVVRRADGTGGIGAAAIANAIDGANELFLGTGIQFCQTGEPWFIDDDNFFQCVCGSDNSLLRTIGRVEGTANVYFVPNLRDGGQSLCGLATYPGTSNSGVVLRNSCVASASIQSTFAHELGHFLDLLHTHDSSLGVECADGRNCQTAGDLVCDTPADPNLYGRTSPNCRYQGPQNGGCAGDAPYAPMVENIMSYARSSCRDTFTPGQIERMRAALVYERPDMARLDCPVFDFPRPRNLVRASETPDGEGANAPSESVAISPKGRFVAFTSSATNLHPAATSGIPQVFLKDLLTGELELISRNPAGEAANGLCGPASVSADGRYVVYSSSARNLVPEVSNLPATGNLYRLDRLTGVLDLVTRAPDGGGTDVWERIPNAVSLNGRFVAFESKATNLVPVGPFQWSRVYHADVATGEILLVSRAQDGTPANGRSTEPSISGDGRLVAYRTDANNLDPADQDSFADVYLWQRSTRSNERRSVLADGTRPFGTAYQPALSLDGRTLVWRWAALDIWPDDPTGIIEGDIAVCDLASGSIDRASETAHGAPTRWDSASPSISAYGRYVAFTSRATEFYDPPIQLADRDVWVKDLHTGALTLASPGGGGQDSLGDMPEAVLDCRGRTVAFVSEAANLVPGDENGVADVFVTWLR